MADYIYVDDSGDSGLKETSSRYLFAVAVVVRDEKIKNELSDAIYSFRKNLGWNDGDELKFNKTNRKKYIKQFIKGVSCFDFEIYAAVLDKERLNLAEKRELSSIKPFIFLTSFLLSKLKMSEPDVYIDGAYGPKYVKQSRTYLRRQLKEQKIMNCSFRFVDSRKNDLIQLADIAAGSIARLYTDTSRTSDDYVKMFGDKIKKVYVWR
ncbi:MAG: DUF3800 domain-containing protein [Candidatus Saccharibacteria bacterium]|nr:DUF3800 domain-containing protein [Candidatus Saccharibacteria bacterium]